MPWFMWWIIGLFVILYALMIWITVAGDYYESQQAKQALISTTVALVFLGLSTVVSIYISPLIGKVIPIIPKFFGL